MDRQDQRPAQGTQPLRQDGPGTRVLFVCLGNICRSPTAEALFRDLVEREGLAGSFEIDSAGTGDWQVGNSPDPRAVEAARSLGIELKGRARQVTADDLERFDLIVAMDRKNHADLMAISGSDGSKIRLLREFGGDEQVDVPDPYLDENDRFAEVLEVIDRNCRHLFDLVVSGAGPGSSTPAGQARP